AIVWNSDTQITATTPAQALGAVNVTVTTTVDSTANPPFSTYTYSATATAPSVASIDPIFGPFAGGQTVTVTGANFVVGTGTTTQASSSKRVACSGEDCWDLASNGSGQVFLEVEQEASNTNYGTQTTTATYADGQWHHVAMTRSGTVLKLYVDGVLPSLAAN